MRNSKMNHLPHSRFSLIIYIITVGILSVFCGRKDAFPTTKKAQGKILAFPSALGYGKYTKGGRGGEVIEVTNLEDSGPGSFRAAVNAEGPRTIIFKVAGTIDLHKPVNIVNPFVTIAGQSAPGQGVTIRNSVHGSVIRIQCSEVIIRGLRIRKGRWSNREDGDCISISPLKSKISNIIIDHCSMSWATDEIIGINDAGRAIFNVSITNNIISEGLSGGPDRNKAVLLNKASDPANGKYIYNVTFYGNLFAHNRNRNVMCSEFNEMEFINNYIYNFNRGTVLKPGAKVSVIGNFYKAGKNTGPKEHLKPGHNGVKNRGILIVRPYINSDAAYYLSDNIGLGRSPDIEPGMNEWDEVWIVDSTYKKQYLVNTPPRVLSGIKPIRASEVPNILTSVGAAAPVRDEIDQRIINDVLNGTGSSIRNQDQVGGFIAIGGSTSPPDTDGDGMPDFWEEENGHNPNIDENAQDADGDGYTNLEEYLNSFF